MPRMPALLAALVLSLPPTLAAQDSTASKPDRKIHRDPQIISLEEIESVSAETHTAFDLVQRLRPFWVGASRGPSSVNLRTAEPVVYVNNMRRGSPAVLLEYTPTAIREIRRLHGTEASMRFGTNHENGAILVVLR